MVSDPHIALSQFAGDDAHALLGVRVFGPKKSFGQRFAKTPVNLADAFFSYGAPATQPAAVDPFLNCDVRLGFQL